MIILSAGAAAVLVILLVRGRGDGNDLPPISSDSGEARPSGTPAQEDLAAGEAPVPADPGATDALGSADGGGPGIGARETDRRPQPVAGRDRPADGEWHPLYGYTNRKAARAHEEKLREQIQESLRQPRFGIYEPSSRAGLIGDLGKYNSDPKTLDLMVWLVRNDPYELARRFAIQGLRGWQHESIAWETVFAAARQDPSPDVRAAAIVWLGSRCRPTHPMREQVESLLQAAVVNEQGRPAEEAVYGLFYVLEPEEYRAYLLDLRKRETRPLVLHAIEIGLEQLEDAAAGRR